MRCPGCGAEAADGARYCSECGARLTAPAASDEQRKTVTVLFSDVSGSTALGERLDPEAMRRVLARFFDTARATVEAHGGTVEKFIGDAVMAVFGIPVLHEDDALRAVRAAAGLHAAVPGLNDELKATHGVTLQLRTGVMTGEVVTGTAERLATGDAVNVAARLEQLAAPGQILLGAPTLELVRDAVEVTEGAALEMKGKSQPVAAYALRAVDPAAPGARRRGDARLIGRDPELLLLTEALRRVVRQQTCGLFTVLGPAGMGKSRLAQAFAATADATLAQGRCVAYGPGSTYGPAAQVADDLLGLFPDLLADEPLAALAVDVLRGRAAEMTSAADLAWAMRKLVERAAERRPLVVVLDDLHWAEPALLDLVDHVVDLCRTAPVLIVALARPDLLDRRPGWAGGKLHATTILLDPLDADEALALVESLAPGLQADVRAPVLEAAAGNPLFVEEMVRLLADGRGGQVPPTIQALLAARLDQLDDGERRVLEVGSVEGRLFHRSAVAALGIKEQALPSVLEALVRKDLLRPAGDGDAYRFRHGLLRDAAYERLAKSARAQLHERLAAWLDRGGGGDELVGWHLEQAVGYRASLGPLDPAGRDLAAEAGRRLASAGLHALEKGDLTAGAALLERSTALRPDTDLELTLANVLPFLQRLDDSIARAEAVADRGAAVGDRLTEAKGRLAAAVHRVQLTDAAPDEFARAVDDLGRVAEGGEDRGAEVWYWSSVATLAAITGRYGDAADAMQRALARADELGWGFVGGMIRIGALDLVALSPAPVDEGLRRADALDEDFPFLPAFASISRARLLAYAGRFDEARAVVAASRTAAEERGEVPFWAEGFSWLVESAAGRHADAVAAGRRACASLEAAGRWSNFSTRAAQLAWSLVALGEGAEAEEWARRGMGVARDDDVETHVTARAALAVAAAHRGALAEAAGFADEALARAEATQAPHLLGQALEARAEVRAAAGEQPAATACLDRAAEVYQRKGAVAFEERVRRRREELVCAEGATER